MSAIRNVIFAAGFATLGAFAAVGAQAAAGPHRGGMSMFGPDISKFAEALDLSAEQEGMLETMRADAKSQRQAHREEKQANKGQLIEMLGQETLDADQIHDLIDTRTNEMASFAHDMADQFIAFHATLDDEQRATLVEKVEEASARHEERQERRGERGGERGERGGR